MTNSKINPFHAPRNDLACPPVTLCAEVHFVGKSSIPKGLITRIQNLSSASLSLISWQSICVALCYTSACHLLAPVVQYRSNFWNFTAASKSFSENQVTKWTAVAMHRCSDSLEMTTCPDARCVGDYTSHQAQPAHTLRALRGMDPIASGQRPLSALPSSLACCQSSLLS